MVIECGEKFVELTRCDEVVSGWIAQYIDMSCGSVGDLVRGLPHQHTRHFFSVGFDFAFQNFVRFFLKLCS